MILSQLIRGAAEELASRPGELVDPVLIGAALARAADQAYGSVREPAEGTILTVVREMAHRVASELAHMPDARLGADASDGEQDLVIADVIESALEAGQESVKRGPDLLPVLREAGVVDAGGYGLTVLLAGIVGALRGAEPRGSTNTAGPRHPSPARLDTYRYCTNFAVTGESWSSAPSCRRWSASATRCSSSATRPRSRSRPHRRPRRRDRGVRRRRGGVPSRRGRHARPGRRARRAAAPARAGLVCGALAVVNGDGMRGLYESFGVASSTAARR